MSGLLVPNPTPFPPRQLRFAQTSKTLEKRKTKQKDAKEVSDAPPKPTGPIESKCDNCGEVFESRSKLFSHLKLTGHATLKGPNTPNTAGKKAKKGKK